MVTHDRQGKLFFGGLKNESEVDCGAYGTAWWGVSEYLLCICLFHGDHTHTNFS